MPRENKVRKQLSEEEKTEIEEAFDLFDTDQDKLLDRDEFKGKGVTLVRSLFTREKVFFSDG